MANLATIEGIGPAYAKKMARCGISTTGALLKNCGDRAGRRKAAKESGCNEKQILGWVNRADLMRVKGVGEEYSDLLELAGVDTVKELATRNAENLHAKMLEVNEKKKAVRRPPAASMVTAWVASAQQLAPAVTY